MVQALACFVPASAFLLVAWAHRSGLDAIIGTAAADTSGFNKGQRNTNAADVFVGTLFDDRFRLLRLLHRNVGEQEVSNDENDGKVAIDAVVLERSDAATERPMPLPTQVSDQFADIEYIREGSFGEVWKARDTLHGDRLVALKMFYVVDRREPRKHWPLTPRRARGNIFMMNRLRDASKECWLAREVQRFRFKDPVGASRLMRCFDDHAVATNDSKHEDLPLYQVFEYCGSLDLRRWMKSRRFMARKSPQEYLHSALSIFAQLLRVLHYLTRFTVQWCHHDIKPGNILVLRGEDSVDYIKVIDFGSMTETSEENARQGSISSPAYAEPGWFDHLGEFLAGTRKQWIGGYSIERPSSYDVYAAATLLDELVTGRTTWSKLKAIRSARSPILSYSVELCKRHRLFLQLHARVTDEDEMKDAQRNEGLARKLCTKWLETLEIKGKSGVERQITAAWGRGGDKWTVEWRSFEASFEHFVFDDQRVAPGFSDVVHEYQSLVKPLNWYETFTRMLAPEPTRRPTPGEILQVPLLRRLEEVSPLRPVPAIVGSVTTTRPSSLVASLPHDEHVPAKEMPNMQFSSGTTFAGECDGCSGEIDRVARHAGSGGSSGDDGIVAKGDPSFAQSVIGKVMVDTSLNGIVGLRANWGGGSVTRGGKAMRFATSSSQSLLTARTAARGVRPGSLESS
eukprot:TRINITY_DN43581_c0_g1_i1.p1 TRINITY_DN43581_c0_g1~~TRINITY_DN43581_c0_g1_i1.p1  ORF type:complete len:683 (+),score=97.25 TRINITY_DN43581_c0_g1_i1:402-2450(+)